MNLRFNQAFLAIVAAACLLTAGCGGITASPTVSPLMFLIPGVGQVRPRAVPAAPDEPPGQPDRQPSQAAPPALALAR